MWAPALCLRRRWPWELLHRIPEAVESAVWGLFSIWEVPASSLLCSSSQPGQEGDGHSPAWPGTSKSHTDPGAGEGQVVWSCDASGRFRKLCRPWSLCVTDMKAARTPQPAWVAWQSTVPCASVTQTVPYTSLSHEVTCHQGRSRQKPKTAPSEHTRSVNMSKRQKCPEVPRRRLI